MCQEALAQVVRVAGGLALFSEERGARDAE